MAHKTPSPRGGSATFHPGLHFCGPPFTHQALAALLGPPRLSAYTSYGPSCSPPNPLLTCPCPLCGRSSLKFQKWRFQPSHSLLQSLVAREVLSAARLRLGRWDSEAIGLLRCEGTALTCPNISSILGTQVGGSGHRDPLNLGGASVCTCWKCVGCLPGQWKFGRGL
jgi:hypothetical protein